MLTIRGADQVCTSLRAARKSLGDGRPAADSRMEELDLIIGELVVGSKSYVGNPVKSKQEIELLVASLSVPSTERDPKDGEALASDPNSDSQSPGVVAAMGHFRRAVATLQRIIAADTPLMQ